MSFKSLVARMDAAITRTFGEVVIYNNRHAVRVVMDRNVERVNEFGELTVNKIELSFVKSNVCKAEKGDSVRTEGGTFTVKEVISDDGSVVVVSAI